MIYDFFGDYLQIHPASSPYNEEDLILSTREISLFAVVHEESPLLVNIL